MSEPVGLDLGVELEEHAADRVHVTVTLSPTVRPVEVTGVAVELFGRRRESLGPRLLLPISGTVTGPIATRAELRCRGPIPRGSFVEATAWMPHEELAATCPAEPPPVLEGHVRGRHPLMSADRDRSLGSLSHTEKCALARCLSWLPAPAAEEKGCDVDAIQEELGLDDEDADWLRELMEE